MKAINENMLLYAIKSLLHTAKKSSNFITLFTYYVCLKVNPSIKPRAIFI